MTQAAQMKEWDNLICSVHWERCEFRLVRTRIHVFRICVWHNLDVCVCVCQCACFGQNPRIFMHIAENHNLSHWVAVLHIVYTATHDMTEKNTHSLSHVLEMSMCWICLMRVCKLSYVQNTPSVGFHECMRICVCSCFADVSKIWCDCWEAFS